MNQGPLPKALQTPFAAVSILDNRGQPPFIATLTAQHNLTLAAAANESYSYSKSKSKSKKVTRQETTSTSRSPP